MASTEMTKESTGSSGFSEQFDALCSCGQHIFATLSGTPPCFVIKVGAGGTVFGHENKYLKLAIWLRERYGSAVLVSDTPVDADQAEDFCTAMDFVLAQSPGPVYYIGVSRGAQEAAAHGWRYPCIQKMLLLNMPMMINWHKSKAGLQQLSPEQQCTLAFGTKDPSFPYLPFARRLECERIKVVKLGEMGHQLSTDDSRLTDLITSTFD